MHMLTHSITLMCWASAMCWSLDMKSLLCVEAVACQGEVKAVISRSKRLLYLWTVLSKSWFQGRTRYPMIQSISRENQIPYDKHFKRNEQKKLLSFFSSLVMPSIQISVCFIQKLILQISVRVSFRYKNGPSDQCYSSFRHCKVTFSYR